MPISDTDVVQATFLSTQQGVRVANVLYMQPSAALGDTIIDQNLTDLGTLVWGSINNFTSDQLVFRCLIARVVTSSSEPVRFYQFNLPGSIVNNPLPTSNCVVVRHYSAPATRRRSGRICFAGVPEVHHRGGRITAGAVLLYADFTTRLRSTGWTGTNATWNGWHFSRADMAYSQIVHANVNPLIKKVRSRQSDLCTF